MELPHGPATPLLGIYLKKIKMLIQKDICTPTFIAAFFTIARMWKYPLTDKWIKKMCCINIHIYMVMDGNLTYCGGHSDMYENPESLCGTPGTNIVL